MDSATTTSAARLPKWRRWTEGEDLSLEALWGSETLKTAVRELARSEGAVRRRARELGLPAIPKGWVSINAAARHCGIDPKSLRYLMRRHGVYRQRWYSERTGGANYRGARAFVDLARVSALLAEETRNWEGVAWGAKRYGLKSETLAAWLRRAGAEVLHKNMNAGHLIARSADIDRVVAACGWVPGRVTLSAAARAIGMSGNSLRRRFERDGKPVPKSNGSDIYLDLDEVRALVARTGPIRTRRSSKSADRARCEQSMTTGLPGGCAEIGNGVEVDPIAGEAWLRSRGWSKATTERGVLWRNRQRPSGFRLLSLAKALKAEYATMERKQSVAP